MTMDGTTKKISTISLRGERCKQDSTSHKTIRYAMRNPNAHKPRGFSGSSPHFYQRVETLNIHVFSTGGEFKTICLVT